MRIDLWADPMIANATGQSMPSGPPTATRSTGNDMRLLIYALESSGASAFCLFVAQREDSIAIVDLWTKVLTPRLDIPGDVVVKATATPLFSLTQHIESFRPDRTILFVREPVLNYASLSKYPYANEFGTIDEKFARFDQELAAWPAELVFRYEDFIAHEASVPRRLSALGWPAVPADYDMARSVTAIQFHTLTHSEWACQEFDLSWGTGNIKGSKIITSFNQVPVDPKLREHVQRLCPHLTALYSATHG